MGSSRTSDGLRQRGLPRSAIACALMAIASVAHAQGIEPRAYSNAPVGVNFVMVGYGYTRGGLSSDTALPVTNVSLETQGALLTYTRVLDLWGKSGKIDVLVPYTFLSGSADFDEVPLARVVNGLADPLFRATINFYGAPALKLKEFENYRQNWIIGASLRASIPLGQYDKSRVVNLGTNRWSMHPEVGISKAAGAWTLELTAGTTLYSANKDFYRGTTRLQDPLYSSESHVIYNFKRDLWASIDGTYFAGGRSTLDGVRRNNLQRNWRAGGTLALPIDKRNSVKLYASRGVSARTGDNFDLIGIVWQYRWGGGL
jgi:hypothetical protein